MTRAGDGYRVTVEIKHAHMKLPNYSLLPGDLLVKQGVQTYAKEAPGLAIIGFVLTPEEEASLEPVTFTRQGLNYTLSPAQPSGTGAA